MISIPFLVNTLFNFAIGLLVARFLGPDEYGHYALAVSIGILIQTMGFDWLRLCATRFYSERDRSEHPEIRATLDVIFAAVAVLGTAVAVAIALSGFKLALPSLLLALAVGVAVATGLFEFATALLRARFQNRGYARLVVSKTVLGMLLTVGGAWYFRSADMALFGLILSIGIALAVSNGVLKDRAARPALADKNLAVRFAVYALPVVLANVLYQGATTTNRAVLSQVHDFAQAGQLALAFDLGIRVIGAIGATLDIYLFQVAVRADALHGPAAARGQISRNMGIIIAVVLPALTGLWLVLPSFEHLLIPPGFQGAFAQDFTLLLPAILCFALSNFCVGPAFQIAHRTMPLILGGLTAAVVNGSAIVLLPRTQDATSFAVAQSLGACAGLAVMLGFLSRLEPMWPRARDVAGTMVGTAAMILCVFPLRSLGASATTLLVQALVGACVFAGIAVAFDIGDLRGVIAARLAGFHRARPALPRPGPLP